MKKFSILAVAAILSLGLASCSKETAEQKVDGATVNATIKIAQDTRKVGAAGTEVAANVNNGIIFLSAPSGNLTKVDIVPAEIAAPTGQTITDVVLGSEVYIVANIPTGTTDYTTALKALTSLADVKTYAMNIKDQAGVTVENVALSNSTSVSVSSTDTGADGEETVSVTLRPVVSRLELTQVKSVPNDGTSTYATGDVIGFSVKGVYLTGFHKGFKWNATGSGEIFNLSTPVVAAEYPEVVTFGQGDTGATPWAATTYVANAGAGNVWGYNIAAATMPYIVVELTNVQIQGGGNVIVDGTTITAANLATTPFYITVSGYTGLAGATTFAAGNIYNVGSLEFSADDLGLSPSSDNVDLTVNVTVTEWITNSIGASI